MTQEGFKRKLTAILSTDAVDYSRLMGEDEEATVRTLNAYREVFTTLIQQHNGQVLDSTGDNLLAEFVSVVDAVQCAVAVQKEIKSRNDELAENRRMQFRIGINLGDVIQEKGRIYGDGVNIAARLEGLSEPGGICISKTAFDHIESKLPYGYDYLGDHTVKNISKPVGAYRVLMEPRVTVSGKSLGKKIAGKRRMPILIGVAAVVVIAVTVGIWQFYKGRTSVEPASVENMALPLPDKPSIVVLPFDNLSGDPEQEYFSDGMTDDLITDLSKISGLFVIARNSSFQYKGQSVDVKKVSRELGIRYVLEGSVRKAEDTVRINAQLIDATTGGHLWAERYDRDYKDIFALQDEIVQHIVSTLAVKLTQGEKDQLAGKYTDNLEAYDYYLRGEQFLHSFSGEGIGKAKSMYEKAIHLDSKFAHAYAAHAMANYYIWRYGFTGTATASTDAREQAFESVTKALALDGRLPAAHSVLAGLYLVDLRYDEAIASAAKAVALDPNNADSYVMQSYVLTKAGTHEEALEAINTAFRLNPKPPPHYYLYRSEVQFNHRQYAEVLESIMKTGNTFAEVLLSWWLAPSYAYLDQIEAAREEIQKLLTRYPSLNLDMVERVNIYKLEEDTKHWGEGYRIAGLKR
jgi:TolB-like protein/class 3 adenylate cyclase